MDSRPAGRPAEGSTRRSFIARSGLLGGAFWLAATGWEKTIGRAVAALSNPSDERRRETYAALVDAVSASDHAAFDGGGRSAALDRFDAWYSAAPDATQRVIDSVLDDVATQFAGGKRRGPKFHEADRGERLEFVRKLKYGGGPGPGARGAAGSGEAIAGKHRLEQVRRHASRPENQGDPTDFSTVKGAEPEGRPPAIAEPSAEEIRANALMTSALAIVAAPVYTPAEFDPESLAKVPPLAV